MVANAIGPGALTVCAGIMLATAAPGAEPARAAAQIASAKPLAIEDVCVPIKSVRTGALYWAPNPDGKTYDLLQWYFKGYGGPTHVFIMDLATGEVKQDGIPLKRQIHIAGNTVGPDGKLYLATPDWKRGMELWVYDPAANVLAHRGLIIPGLAGERRPLVVGTDGMIYGSGSYNASRKAGAYQIDPTTGKITDYGPVGPSHAPNGCWGYYAAADDRCVYVASGKIPWYLVAYDRRTGKDEVLLTTEKVGAIVVVQQHRYGCTAWAKKVVGTDGKRVDYWLWQGKAIPKKSPREKPPWPVPERPEPWVHMPPRPQVSLALATPASDGRAEIRWRPRPAKGETQEDWRVIPLSVPTYPQGTYRVAELPDGRIFGTAGAYEGMFVYDPATGQCEHPGKIHLSHYATAIHRGRIYMCGYPSSPLYVYDLAKPWTAQKGEAGGRPLAETDERSNPRLLVRLNQFAGTHKMYSAAVGADGKVYFGGRWIRNGAGGGLAWWDPETREAGGFWEVFSNYQIDYLAAAADGRLIVVGTLAVRDATLGKPTPKQGKLFVFDTAQGKIVREIEPVPGARGTGPIACAAGSRVVGITVDPQDERASILYGVDVDAGAVAFRTSVPHRLPVRIGGNQKEAFDFRPGPDGKVWTFLGGALVRIDPGNGGIETVGTTRRPGRLAFSGQDVYLAGAERLRRIKGAVEARGQ